MNRLKSLVFLSISSALLLSGCLQTMAGPAVELQLDPSKLVAIWRANEGPRELQSWPLSGFSGENKKLKQRSCSEKDPVTSKMARWKGVLLSELVDQALAVLPPELKAEVDLIVLKGASGAETLMPRALVTKYPLLVASRRDGEDLKGLQLVVPWTSQPKILKEYLPLENYFVAGLSAIELSSFKEKYGTLYLERRTDPAALKGEKIFVHNCTGCHAAGRGPSIAELPSEARVRTLASTGHPVVKGTPPLTEEHRRALVCYLEAYRKQIHMAASASPAQQTAQARP